MVKEDIRFELQGKKPKVNDGHGGISNEVLVIIFKAPTYKTLDFKNWCWNNFMKVAGEIKGFSSDVQQKEIETTPQKPSDIANLLGMHPDPEFYQKFFGKAIAKGIMQFEVIVDGKTESNNYQAAYLDKMDVEDIQNMMGTYFLEFVMPSSETSRG